jgi:hypothetical protein
LKSYLFIWFSLLLLAAGEDVSHACEDGKCNYVDRSQL